MIPNFAGCPACSPLLKFLAGDLLRKRCLFVVPPLRQGGDQPGDESKLSVEHIPAVHEPLAERPQIAVGQWVARDNPDCSYFLSRSVQDGFGASTRSPSSFQTATQAVVYHEIRGRLRDLAEIS